MLTILAPAKLNLTLEVLGERPDGYHEIRTALQTINLYDCLDFRPSREVTFKSDSAGWSAAESLVTRAAGLMRKVAGDSKGAMIKIEKHIPLVSGLGGDSSDAAGVLRGLNELWGLNWPREKLLELAEQLGSDVAFFVGGGTVLVEGRGEMITPLPSLPEVWVVLVVPDIARPAGKTKKLYASLKPNHYTDGQFTEKFIKALKEGRQLEASMLFNTFENVAYDLFPKLKMYNEHVKKLGATHVHLAGSGPTLFTIFKEKAQAEDLFMRCKNQGMEVYLVTNMGAI